MLKLSSSKIQQFLVYWLNHSAAKRFPFVPIINDFLIDAVQQGISESDLKTSLIALCPIDEALISNFIRKLKHKICDIQSERDLSPRHQRDSVPVTRNTQSKVQKPNYVTTTSSGNRSENIPSTFFLPDSAFSLRRSDQKVKPLVLNDHGQRVDDCGNQISTPIIHLQDKQIPLPYDKRIPTVTRPVNGDFRFIEPGKISQEAQAKREKVEVDLSVARGFPLFDVIALQRNVEKPEVDWWDEPFVGPDLTPNYDSVDDLFQNTEPIPVARPAEREMPTFLLADERKKMKHVEKLRAENERRELIKFGLLPKEEPRIKQNTLISLSSVDAVLAPTEVALRAQEQRDSRINDHEARNAAAKLTDEERHAKKDLKRMQDAQTRTPDVAVLVVPHIDKPLQFATLMKMAQKWYLKGGLFIVDHPQMAFVIVEGGPRGVSKYEALFMRRIVWGPDNEPVLAFRGIDQRRHFTKFKKIVMGVGTQCRAYCARYGAESYFDTALRVVESFEPAEQTAQ